VRGWLLGQKANILISLGKPVGLIVAANLMVALHVLAGYQVYAFPLRETSVPPFSATFLYCTLPHVLAACKPFSFLFTLQTLLLTCTLPDTNPSLSSLLCKPFSLLYTAACKPFSFRHLIVYYCRMSASPFILLLQHVCSRPPLPL
jgi:hypothetical protein